MKKVFKVSEKQYGILMEYYLKDDAISLLIPRRFGNPVEEDLRRYYKGELDEGYYKTYPIQSVYKYIKILVGDNGSVRVDTDNTIHPLISVLTYNTNNRFLDELNKAFELCGYYKSGVNDVEGYEGLKSYFYEARYTDDINQHVREIGYLYHVSPQKHLTKILKNGLCPRATNQYFNYPPRVYMMSGNASKEHIVNVAYTLANGKTNQNKNNLKDANIFNDEWCVFLIDVKKLPTDTKFYSDTSMFDGYALFTYDNIPPSAIKLVGRIPV